MSDKPALAVVAKFPAEKIVKPAWTPLSCLEEFVERVRSGEIKPTKVMIFYCEQDEAANRTHPHYWTQGVSVAEQIAYAQWLTIAAIEDWKS